MLTWLILTFPRTYLWFLKWAGLSRGVDWLNGDDLDEEVRNETEPREGVPG